MKENEYKILFKSERLSDFLRALNYTCFICVCELIV